MNIKMGVLIEEVKMRLISKKRKSKNTGTASEIQKNKK